MFARNAALILVVLCGVVHTPARADVRLHPLFSDDMVIQRDTAVPIRGTADPYEEITVVVTPPNAQPLPALSVVAESNGTWQVLLPANLTAGTGYTLTVSGKNTITLRQVAVGDVWLCSGQSNMEVSLGWLGQPEHMMTINPSIRLLTIPSRIYPRPQREYVKNPPHGQWLRCQPIYLRDFSAVGYFFGREIQKSQNVPVGLISAAWGGTMAEAWTSATALSSEPALKRDADAARESKLVYDPARWAHDYKMAVDEWRSDLIGAIATNRRSTSPPEPPRAPEPNRSVPSGLFNGMIAPLTWFPIKGVIWYQGENNSVQTTKYRTLLPRLIQDWRAQWGYEFPVLIVQIAPFVGGPSGVDFAEIRDVQATTARTVPKVGLVVTTDIGNETDIHPKMKEPVGVRLALVARALVYGEAIEYSGPEFKSISLEGGKAVLRFDHLGGGLVCRGATLTGFRLAGMDRRFWPATATISGDTVVVTSPYVLKPTAVRFGWANYPKPELNFFNAAGLPAIPFRTDDFPFTTSR